MYTVHALCTQYKCICACTCIHRHNVPYIITPTDQRSTFASYGWPCMISGAYNMIQQVHKRVLFLPYYVTHHYLLRKQKTTRFHIGFFVGGRNIFLNSKIEIKHIFLASFPGSPSAFPSGGSKVIRGIIARKEGEPGNEATFS